MELTLTTKELLVIALILPADASANEPEAITRWANEAELSFELSNSKITYGFITGKED